MNTNSMPDLDHPYGSAGGAVHEARGSRVGPPGPSRPKKKWGLVVGFAVAGVVLAGCGQSTNDAPTVGGDEVGDRSPAQVIAMPDGFSNVASKCDPWGNRIYVLYHGGNPRAGITVVPQDKSCGAK